MTNKQKEIFLGDLLMTAVTFLQWRVTSFRNDCIFIMMSQTIQ